MSPQRLGLGGAEARHKPEHCVSTQAIPDQAKELRGQTVIDWGQLSRNTENLGRCKHGGVQRQGGLPEQAGCSLPVSPSALPGLLTGTNTCW